MLQPYEITKPTNAKFDKLAQTLQDLVSANELQLSAYALDTIYSTLDRVIPNDNRTYEDGYEDGFDDGYQFGHTEGYFDSLDN